MRINNKGHQSPIIFDKQLIQLPTEIVLKRPKFLFPAIRKFIPQFSYKKLDLTGKSRVEFIDYNKNRVDGWSGSVIF